MKDSDLYSRILGLSAPWFVATSSWTRPEAVWMSMLSTLPALADQLGQGQERHGSSYPARAGQEKSKPRSESWHR